jgi:hypothetical protein
MSDNYMFLSCGCALCEFIKEYNKNPDHTSGAWCDPRRQYLESDEDFIKRVPDGFLSWPDRHKNIPNPESQMYGFLTRTEDGEGKPSG